MTDKSTVVIGKGWKTYAGGIGLMLSAISGVIFHYTNPEDVAALTITAASTKFFGGLAIFGIGHKMQRGIDILCQFLNK